MTGKITITNQSQTVSVIDIEGEIGVPEAWQFENPGERVATYERFRERVEQLKKIEKPEVIVNIRSAGGGVNDAILIFEALSELEGNVTTRCFGYVASAATIIAQAATKGGREMSKNALYLIHKAACKAEGNHEELEQSLDILKKTDQRIAEIYRQRAGVEAQKYIELMAENGGKGRWLSPQEAKKWGLIDRVIGEGEGVKDIEKVVLNVGLPPIPEKMVSKIKSRERWSERARKIERQWEAILEIVGISKEKSVEKKANTESSVELSTTVTQSSVAQGSDQDLGQQELGANDEISSSENVPVESHSQPLEHHNEASTQSRESEEMAECVTGAVKESVSNSEGEVESLRERIEELERDNARMLIGATSTLPKEDPGIQGAQTLTPNQEAYSQDIQMFNEVV